MKQLKNKRGKTKSYILFLATILVVYFTLATSYVTEKYNYVVGDIAKADIKASKDIEDKYSTEQNIQEALSHVQDIYKYDSSIKKNAIQAVNDFFVKLSKVKKDDSSTSDKTLDDKAIAQLMEGKVKTLKEQGGITSLSNDNYKLLLTSSDEDIEQLKQFTIKVLDNMYETTNIQENKPEDIVKAQGVISSDFNSSSFSSALKEVGKAICYSQVKESYFKDEENTNKMKEEAQKNVKQVVIKKDQIIVKEGEPVTKAQYEILKSLGFLDQDISSEIIINILLFILVVFIIILQWIYLKEKYIETYKNYKKLLLINILTILTVMITRGLMIVSPYFIPFACIPILLTVLLDEKIATIIGVLNVVFICFIVHFSVDLSLIALINVIIVPIAVKKIQQRNDLIYSSLLIALINFIFTAIVGYFLNSNVTQIFSRALMCSGAGVLSGILAIGILPFLENMFDIVTNIKLLELSNPNHPLMKRLLLEAPGTYHHSVLVANLAEFAAESIGANAIYARTAAYYHDVGKLERPYYFKENQISIDNPHDKMEPSLSAMIIISHVEDGVRLAKKYALPQMIIDVIKQHHGDSLVKYFYITMKNASDNPDEVKVEDYQYKGPAPYSKEASIVMLADGVEAAVRSIQNPTQEKIEKMVDNIIKGRLDEDQLINSELTFKDIKIIRAAFLKSLSGVYHQRIEYPKDKSAVDKGENK